MMRLVGAEAQRWLARRGLWVALLGSLAIIAVFVISVVAATRPPATADLEGGRQAYAEQHAYWVAHHEADQAECLRSLPAKDADSPNEMCAMPEPQPEWFIQQPMTWKDAATSGGSAGAVVGGLVGLLMAASFWGAEIRSGSLATWLTFVPSRSRVWASKMVVSAIGGALVAAVLIVISLAAAWLSISLQQGPDAVGDLSGPLQVAGRGVLFGAMMALLGAGLAVIFRSTVAAVGVPLAYLFVQGMLGILNAIPGFHHLMAFLPELNVRAFLEGGTTYTVPVPKSTPHGVEYDFIDRTISLAQGTVYLLVFVAVAAAVSLVVFQRRDVTE